MGTALFGLFLGWRVGFMGAVFNSIGLAAGLFLAARFSDDISAWVTDQGASDATATVLAYIIIIIAVFLGAQVASNVAKKMLRMVFLGWVETLGSVALGVIFGLILSGALILGAARFSSDVLENYSSLVLVGGIRGNIQDSMVESTLVPVFVEITEFIPADTFGFIPGDFKTSVDQLRDRINQK